ncbi:MAG: endonuclease/exonuclease/phosphatase family protein [Gammaproteobacteria bacterium]|nr:endonuclease/exonuclease/phosphatase family protein [Gammaproteobacteria bacterium]
MLWVKNLEVVRLYSLNLLLVVSLVLLTGVSMAAQERMYSSSATTKNTVIGGCDADQILQNSQALTDNDLSELNPNRISLLNWNIYKGKRDDWASDFERYSHKHDILTIQEAHLDDELEYLLEDEHHNWALNVAFDYQDRATGVMTASTIKPVSLCGQRTKEPWIRTPKTSLISYYPLAGIDERLLVANLHGINFTFGTKAYNRQIENLYDTIKHHDGPLILAGDFNTWSDKRLRIVDGLARRLGLSSLDYSSHNRTSVFGNAIDHVFYRGLEAVEHDSWQVTSSDHNPTRVRFRINSYYLVDDGVSGQLIDENNC